MAKMVKKMQCNAEREREREQRGVYLIVVIDDIDLEDRLGLSALLVADADGEVVHGHRLVVDQQPVEEGPVALLRQFESGLRVGHGRLAAQQLEQFNFRIGNVGLGLEGGDGLLQLVDVRVALVDGDPGHDGLDERRRFGHRRRHRDRHFDRGVSRLLPSVGGRSPQVELVAFQLLQLQLQSIYIILL